MTVRRLVRARDDNARARTHTHTDQRDRGRLWRALEFFARARRFANNSRSVSRRCVVPDASAIQPLNAEITSYLFVSRTQLRKFIHRPRSPVSVCEATRGPLCCDNEWNVPTRSSSSSASSSSFSSSRARQTVASLINLSILSSLLAGSRSPLAQFTFFPIGSILSSIREVKNLGQFSLASFTFMGEERGERDCFEF